MGVIEQHARPARCKMHTGQWLSLVGLCLNVSCISRIVRWPMPLLLFFVYEFPQGLLGVALRDDAVYECVLWGCE